MSTALSTLKYEKDKLCVFTDEYDNLLKEYLEQRENLKKEYYHSKEVLCVRHSFEGIHMNDLMCKTIDDECYVELDKLYYRCLQKMNTLRAKIEDILKNISELSKA